MPDMQHASSNQQQVNGNAPNLIVVLFASLVSSHVNLISAPIGGCC